MKHLDRVEQALGVKLPKLFRRLWADGALSKRDAAADPVAVLQYLIDFQPVPPEELLAKREELKTVFQVAVDQHQLLPFATTEQGDHFCFYFAGAAGDSVPVVYLPYDEDTAHIQAQDLADFLFRAMLQHATTTPADSLAAARTEYLRMCEALRPYLAAERLALLTSIAASKGRARLLPPAEARKLIKQHLAFPRLNQQFVYTT